MYVNALIMNLNCLIESSRFVHLDDTVSEMVQECWHFNCMAANWYSDVPLKAK